MSKNAIRDYYDTTTHREIRDDLRFAVTEVETPAVAIDCGCGAGRDIAFLRERGFTVYAFDIEPEAIARCEHRFRGDNRVILEQASFSNFSYPAASLVCADASLFFCPPDEFPAVWQCINEALQTGGVFSGSFLGPRDSMANDDDGLWSEVTVLTEAEIRPLLADFEVLKWTEHEMTGESAPGKPHHWHIFSVVAKKRS